METALFLLSSSLALLIHPKEQRIGGNCDTWSRDSNAKRPQEKEIKTKKKEIFAFPNLILALNLNLNEHFRLIFFFVIGPETHTFTRPLFPSHSSCCLDRK
jgi:hypothetical protein